jgi:hypothetical protein
MLSAPTKLLVSHLKRDAEVARHVFEEWVVDNGILQSQLMGKAS